MIRHLLKLIWTQRQTNLLITLELLLVSVCLWYVVDFMYVSTTTYFKPLGFDIKHTYNISFNELEPDAEGYIAPENKKTTQGEDFLKILERIRRYPGVEAVCYSRVAIPYSGSTMNGSVYILRDNDSLKQHSIVKYISKEFLQVFRFHTPDGKYYGKEIPLPESGVIISSDLIDSLFTTSVNPIGQKFYTPMNNIGQQLISGLTTPIRSSEFETAYPCVHLITSPAEMAERNQGASWHDVSIRVSPAADKDFVERFRKEMKQHTSEGNLYLLSIFPFSFQRKNQIEDNTNELNNRTAIVFFLLMNVFLGVIGTFWFRTQQRRGEIGTRMAMGAYKGNVFNMLINEGLLLLTLAWLSALFICWALSKTSIIDTELLAFSTTRFVVAIAITYLLLALMIILGIWFPARKAVKISPAEALRDE